MAASVRPMVRRSCCDCVSARVPGQMCGPIVGRKMVAGLLIGALSSLLLVTGITVTRAQSPAIGGAKPAAKAQVAARVPLPASPRGLRDVSVAVPLPSPELLERQSEPDCEIPASDRLLGAIPETTRLIYERQCYKNAETVVRGKLQLLQDTIASTVKALNDADPSRTLQSAKNGERGAPAPAAVAAIAPKTSASAKSGDAPGNANDERDAKSDASGHPAIAPPDQHRIPTPSPRPSVILSAREGAKSSSPDAALSEQAHHEKTLGTQTPNVLPQSKPVVASAKALACQTSRPPGPGPRSWRLIEGRKCWYEGAAGVDRSLLHWPPLKED